MRVSDQLREARESQNLSVQAVAEITKIRTDHIRALEEANYDVFSAPVYIRGFVRSYATILKLNVPQVMAALDSELRQTEKFSEPPPLTDEPRGFMDLLMLQLSKLDWRKSLAGLSVLAVALIVVILVVVTRHYRKADPLRNMPPGVYHSTQSTSGQTLPLPSPKR